MDEEDAGLETREIPVTREQSVQGLLEHEGLTPKLLEEAGRSWFGLSGNPEEISRCLLDCAVSAATDIHLPDISVNAQQDAQVAIQEFLRGFKQGPQDIRRSPWILLRELNVADPHGGSRGKEFVAEVAELTKHSYPPGSTNPVSERAKKLYREGVLTRAALTNLLDPSVACNSIGFAMKLCGVNVQRVMENLDRLIKVLEVPENRRNLIQHDLMTMRQGIAFYHASRR